MSIQTLVDNARQAMADIKDYTQEQADRLVYAAAKAIHDNAEVFAEEAVAESRLGRVDHKIGKNKDTAAYFVEYLKDKKSVGIINEIQEKGLIEVAHPVGVICAVIPATNPCNTTLGNFLHAVKGKNAIIITPAPRAANTIAHTVNVIREAMVNQGAPADLIQILEAPTFESTAELMKACDLVLATGGWGLTKAAYSSGTPAYGVGPGNSFAILDRDFDLKKAAELTLVSKSADNGILCDGTNVLFYPEETEDALFAAFTELGVALFDAPAEVDKFRQAIFPGGKADPEINGKDAPVIAQAAGVDVPETTELIALKVDSVGAEDLLNKEIMAPVVRLKSYSKFEDAVDMAIAHLENEGIGHTGGIYTHDQAHVRYAGERIPVSRMLVNQPTTDAWGPMTNGLCPAVSEGCGTWAGNILSENVDYFHLLNISKIALPREVEVPTTDSIFA